MWVHLSPVSTKSHVNTAPSCEKYIISALEYIWNSQHTAFLLIIFYALWLLESVITCYSSAHRSLVLLFIWQNFNALCICCGLNFMFYTEIKRACGAKENKREASIKMWENAACSNVDYLLLWQCVWILQAAGLLLFLNKAIFTLICGWRYSQMKLILWIVSVSVDT